MTRRNGHVTDEVADQLLDSYQQAPSGMQHLAAYELPSAEQVTRVVEQCRALLFPGFAGAPAARLNRTELRDLVRERVDELRNSLRRQVYRGLNHRQQVVAARAGGECPSCAVEAEVVADRFIERLPELRAALAKDVRAAFEGDPAATGADEILVCYPGFYATTVYRIAHALLREGAQIIPRMMTELAHERTGIDIHPGATIGESCFIDHGTGVVIGETTVIGDRVRVYQGVTLGALSVPRSEARPVPGARRHPTIEDDVVIYAGATILGGDTVIGKGAIIGGNAWVTGSVAAGSRVAGAVARRDVLDSSRE
jgi:serine O-acetyltransferase